jgi:regulator of sigma D
VFQKRQWKVAELCYLLIRILRLDENNINLEAQIQTDNMLISETQKIYKEINDHLHEHFDINHAIIQFVVDEYKH